MRIKRFHALAAVLGLAGISAAAWVYQRQDGAGPRPAVATAPAAPGADGPAADFVIRLVPTDTGDIIQEPESAVAMSDPSGSFLFYGVPAGQYVLKGLTEWRAGWERKGYRNSKGEQVANLALWKQLFAAADARTVTTRWVRGHNGDVYNERADALANKALATKSRSEG